MAENDVVDWKRGTGAQPAYDVYRSPRNFTTEAPTK